MEALTPTRRQTLRAFVRVFFAASAVGLAAMAVFVINESGRGDATSIGWVGGVCFGIFGLSCVVSLVCLMALWSDMTGWRTRSEKAGWLVYLGSIPWLAVYLFWRDSLREEVRDGGAAAPRS